MTDRLDLLPRHRKELEALLRQHVPDADVWAYGSRVNGRSHEASDLDLALRGPHLEPLGYEYVELVEALEQSNIPILVQAHDWARLPESFHREIERDYVVVQQGADMSEWRSMPFSEAVLVNPSLQLQRDTEYPFVDMAAVNPGIRWAYTERQRKYSGGGSRFLDGDTLMARITPCLENGKIARYRALGGMAVAHGSTEFIVIRGRPGVTDDEFAYYVTQSPALRNYTVSQMTGTSGRQRVPTAALDHIDVALPPLPEQRAIAHILGALDDKIELNRRMNQTLEAMARAIFQDWFVDFGPVRAKLEGREPYLPLELWDLFPDRLADSEVGEIPAGWEVKALGKVSNLNPESWSRANSPARVEYVDLANTKWGVIESTKNYFWKDAPSRARRVLRSGDTVVGTVRPGNGSYSLIGDDGLTASTGFAVLRPLHPRFRELVYLSSTAPDNIERLAHRADGAAYPAVRPEIVAETKIAIPIAETGLLGWFSKTVGAILDKMESAKRECRALSAQRDALLPKLVSGELRVGA